jgi:hypothetical protein
MFVNGYRWIGVVAIVLILAGCKGGGDDDRKKEKPITQLEAKKDNLGKPIPAQTASLVKVGKLLSFKESVILDQAPEGELQPPEKTYTGKNAVKIYETIANGLWDQVTFANNDGKPIRYRGVIATELGEIHVDLFGEHAPNHVRNFVCLARTGYYDGMNFYYSINRKVEDGTIAYIETGCPRGTGEAGSGSIVGSTSRRNPIRTWMASSRSLAASRRGWTLYGQSIKDPWANSIGQPSPS